MVINDDRGEKRKQARSLLIGRQFAAVRNHTAGETLTCTQRSTIRSTRAPPE